MRRMQAAMFSVAAVLASVSTVMLFHGTAEEQARVTAAQQLATESAKSSPPALPSTVAPTTSSAPASSATKAVSPSSVGLPASSTIAYPIKGFTWSTAGINVKVDLMARDTWQQQKSVDPPLDQYGYDPVGHWLEGTGPAGDGQVVNMWQRPVALQIAAHTCYDLQDPLCNNTTFPFSQLSYAGWAVGQHATITDAKDRVFDMTLIRRDVVSKSGFGIDTDPCHVQVFSCNKQDPHNSATQVTFKFSQCPAA